jgi:hypothetical protein
VLQGDRVDQNGPVTHVSGNATVITDSHELKANSVDFNSNTGWAEANGEVRVRSFGTKLSASDRNLLAEREKALAALKAKYGPNYPDVRLVEAELARLEMQLKASAWSIPADSVKLRVGS